MKRGLILVFILLIPLASGIVINEFESNPAGTDAGNEWVELYSEQEINLNGWKLINADNDIFDLNATMSGYYVVEFPKQWLDNSDEKVILLNGDEIIDETPLLDDSSNNDKSWNLCNEWDFIVSSKGSENNCEQEQEEQPEEEEEPEEEEPEPEQEQEEEPEEQKEQTQEQEIKYHTSILDKPTSMKFGEVAIVKAKFFSDADYNLLFLLYSAPERIVRDIDESVITSNKVDVSTAIEAKVYKGNEIEFSLPLNLFDNCNKYYPDDEYEIFLRGFYSVEEWKNLGDLASFTLVVEYNKDLCESEKEKEQAKKQVSTTGKTTQALYLSNSKIIKNLGLWILIIVTLSLLILIWKKKLI